MDERIVSYRVKWTNPICQTQIGVIQVQSESREISFEGVLGTVTVPLIYTEGKPFIPLTFSGQSTVSRKLGLSGDLTVPVLFQGDSQIQLNLSVEE